MVFGKHGDKALYRRVLIKLSGEALSGPKNFGLDPETIQQFASVIKKIVAAGTEVAVVVGGGNIFRGFQGLKKGVAREAGDEMGMLATIINGIALQQALVHEGCEGRVFSALGPTDLVERFVQARAVQALEEKQVVICVGGTGHPFFTTDTCATLRAAQLKVDVVIKATNVDGVFDKDPAIHSDAKRYDEVSFQEVIEKNLQVMDMQAFSMCRENQIPIKVVSVDDLLKATQTENIGTVVK